MPFSEPRVKYVEIRDAIIAMLTAASTTINEGLSESVIQIIKGNPFVTTIPSTMYPSVLVQFTKKTEEIKSFGNTNAPRTKVTITYNIYAIVRVMSSSEDSDDEVAKLADNIEAVFRDNTNINGNVDWSVVIDMQSGSGDIDGTYVSMAILTIDCIKNMT